MEMNLFTFLPFFQAVGTIGTGAFFFSTPETRSTQTARGAWQLVYREMQQRFWYKSQGLYWKFDALTSILLLTYTEPRFLEYRVWNMFERDIYHVLNRLEHSQANVYLVFFGKRLQIYFFQMSKLLVQFLFWRFLRVLLAFLSDCSNDCQQSQGYFNIFVSHCSHYKSNMINLFTWLPQPVLKNKEIQNNLHRFGSK